MKNYVLGLGVSGAAAARFLIDRGEEVVGVDRRVLQKPYEVISDEGSFDRVTFDRLIVSPGVDPSHPLYQRAAQIGAEILGESELALRDCGQTCIGITGTNGKSTTVMQIAHVLNRCGMQALAVGNIGTPVSEVVGGDEILVVELSSYQLETMSTPVLEAAAILNITPDHLDRYKTMEAYAAAKWRIRDLVIEGGLFLHDLDSNMAYTRAITRHFGVSESAFDQAISTFKGLPHRMERFKGVDGISFYNDSKGTNVAATVHAVEHIEGSVILLAGGVDKGSTYCVWNAPFASKVRTVFAFGEAKEKIKDDLKGPFEVVLVENLKEATERALEIAQRGESILLSPGCSSLDQFENFQERGTLFKQYVEEFR